MSSQRKFAIYAWSVFFYNLLVIAWGAYVRATGSGAGCGAHWPLCNGVIIPREPRIETIVEFSHRVSSGLTLVLVVILVIWAWRAFVKGSLVRKAAVFAVVFTSTEALVGAGLVLFELVAENTSLTRAFSMMVHLVNTYLLLGALTLTAWWAARGEPERLAWPGINGVILVVGLVGMLVLGASGAVTALGDTLFPAASLAEGIQQDFSPTAHFLIRLRILHPVIAASVGVYLLAAVFWLRSRRRMTIQTKITNLLIGLFACQLALGILNIYLLAPVWLQMIHLVMSDLIWAALVLAAETWFGFRGAIERPADQPVEVGVKSAAPENP
ncbi:MAG TPA: cytochrome oxidase assembly protein [Anaerolineaceae bacterium]|nr:cytochrome oxidase assembly protein [Anaerolineaceae bacterium]